VVTYVRSNTLPEHCWNRNREVVRGSTVRLRKFIYYYDESICSTGVWK